MRGLAFIPTLVANPARDLFCAPLMPIHYQSRGYKTPNIHFRTHTHIFRHERLCAIFLLLFVRARCITLATRAAGVFVCVRDDKSKSSKTYIHTPAKYKLQKLALGRGGWRCTLCCWGRMKNDARRGIKVSEMGSPTVWLTDWLYVLGNRQMRIKGRLQTPSARFSHAGSQTDNARELLDYHTLCRCGERCSALCIVCSPHLALCGIIRLVRKSIWTDGLSEWVWWGWRTPRHITRRRELAHIIPTNFECPTQGN